MRSTQRILMSRSFVLAAVAALACVHVSQAMHGILNLDHHTFDKVENPASPSFDPIVRC